MHEHRIVDFDKLEWHLGPRNM